MAEENDAPEAAAEEAAPATPEAAPAAAEETQEPAAAPQDEAPVAEAAPAEGSETPATEGSETPAAEGSETPAAEGSETPAAEGGEGEVRRPAPKKDIFAEIDPKGEEAPKIIKAKGSKNVTHGIVHISATFNNTIVSVTDTRGNVLGWSSSGKMGFRGSRKSTAYASQLVSQDACRQAMSHGLKEAEVRVKGPGSGRESAVRAVQNLGIEVTTIRDVTPIPHNGCRPPKARRV